MKVGAPLHGGNLDVYVERYGIARERWLDLSTGINPCAYPVPPIPDSVLHTLPYRDPRFEQAAMRYYHAGHLLAVPGSQWAIEQLPDCFPCGSVAVPEVGYREHLYQWQRRGHEVLRYDPARLHEELPDLLSDDLRAVVVINPNNPSADRLEAATLRAIAVRLGRCDTTLIVDEAFVDAEPGLSLLSGELPANVVVLRSFGKFFGLPGVRLGFVMGQNPVVEALRERLGLWSVSGVAQHVAREAFTDKAWQCSMRDRLASWSADYHRRIGTLLGEQQILASGHTSLFASFLLMRQQAQRWFEGCALRGVLVRLWLVDDHHAYLRFGLIEANDSEALARLERVLEEAGA